ncbi:KTSC domain-containing protein [Jeotgalibacillus sp. S-D1]|uniref:KTSC domain-containing protein n=1 Tax=Jeotgalibacillus sp. S-D1 TaxID=2552189 RepID=UPI001059E8F2|nr:KTSC domain-containing protein [Jeotgalibacillus sp. S-D1]TDL31281.1 KTSC domain-containing protein [Jeotgalibacillus sp. S-D1]
MKMQPVKSSLIIAVGYDESFEILRIQFRVGTYDYYSVPKFLYENLMSAFSKSRYYALFIQDSYAYSPFVKERELTY